MPVRSRNFDEAFKQLNIKYKLERKCSWENYLGFLKIIKDIQDVMNQILPFKTNEKAKLIDAHSFLWIIHEEIYINWTPSFEIEANMEWTAEHFFEEHAEGSGKKGTTVSTVFERSKEVADLARKRANGVCNLCRNSAPFYDRKGAPYLEVHHVEWLSRGGKDSTDNTVALCPNCHAKMHIVDDQSDVEILKKVISNSKQDE